MKILPKLFRTSNWWNYIFPPILGVAYCGILLSGGVFMENWLRLLMFFISFLFTASFGFFLNDMTDISEDLLVSKPNFSAKIKPIIRYFILSTLLIVSILPWFFIKNSYPALLFYIFQVILLILYSVKPFRLKKFTFPAIISDSLYSSLIPALIAIFLFYDKTQSLPSILICIIVMFFLRGLRNILNHHIIDSKYDKLLNTGNFAVKYGDSITLRIIKTFAFIEFMLLILLAFIIPKQFQEYYFYFLLFSTIYFIFKLLLKNNKIKCLIEKIQFANDFYEDLLPLLLLTLLTIHDYNFVILFIFHVIVFKNKVVKMIFLTFFVSFLYGIIYRKACGLINRILGTKL